MVAFRILSDIHLEFARFDLPHLDTDKDDVLVLAGDIGVVHHPKTFDCVKEWIPRFRHTIMIRGNHEFYEGSLLRVPDKQREIFKEELQTGKLSIVNNEVVRIDNVSFICATLWTNYMNGNPVIMQTVRGALNDYRYIRTGNIGEPYLRRINPHDILNEFTISKEFIFKSIEQEKYIDGQKIVVVTHHGPSTLSIHQTYHGDPVNWGYVSDLWNQVADAQPDFWIHGHTHHSFSYEIEKTHVYTNPRGYARKVTRGYTDSGEWVNENSQFDPTLRIEV